MSQKCTPLWREAHFQVKMLKTLGVRTTFGGSDVEKVHAVVARSTFRSQIVEKTRRSDHLWKFRCRFASLHDTTLHYTTLHSTILHSTTLHYITQHYNYTTTQLHSTTLHYTKLHHTTLHYTPLHYTTLHYTALPSTTLHYITLHYTTLHYNYNKAFREVGWLLCSGGEHGGGGRGTPKAWVSLKGPITCCRSFWVALF